MQSCADDSVNIIYSSASNWITSAKRHSPAVMSITAVMIAHMGSVHSMMSVSVLVAVMVVMDVDHLVAVVLIAVVLAFVSSVCR